MNRILIAGIGNIFHGDDAFGVEVVSQLQRTPLPDGVRAVDFGIRSYDLAYAIADGHDTVILVDASARGAKPGTLYLLELDFNEQAATPVDPDAHSLNPVAVLRWVRSTPPKLVACISSAVNRPPWTAKTAGWS